MENGHHRKVMDEVAYKNLCCVAIKMTCREKILRSGKVSAITLNERKPDETPPYNRRGVTKRCRGGHGGAFEGVAATEGGDVKDSCSFAYIVGGRISQVFYSAHTLLL